MGFEPTTPTLARLCSTPELRPHPVTPGAGLPARPGQRRRNEAVYARSARDWQEADAKKVGRLSDRRGPCGVATSAPGWTLMADWRLMRAEPARRDRRTARGTRPARPSRISHFSSPDRPHCPPRRGSCPRACCVRRAPLLGTKSIRNSRRRARRQGEQSRWPDSVLAPSVSARSRWRPPSAVRPRLGPGWATGAARPVAPRIRRSLSPAAAS